MNFLDQLSPEVRKRNDEALEMQRLLKLWYTIAPNELDSHDARCIEQRDLNQLQRYWVKTREEWKDDMEERREGDYPSYGQWSLDLAYVTSIRQEWGGL